ncbi:wd-40 repeat protein [Stylonychia lemnae]|uniref:Wd-40 repeat protein n=1 Tax=Stylonychia lemnae TaxID=5949 RepID=A0A078B321_STYLE|nr:wd-40 repeat protein [Stylonychia lemnae]|eukprot:CDW88905.1 wd-40 repeat protein [Stylonychia lemnae]
MQSLTAKISKKFEDWEKKQFFTHKCIDEKSESCNPVEYFRETSFFIEMTQLYDVKSTCYNNDEMKYMPILVQVRQKQINDFLGGHNYLLQVWDTTTRKKVYQLPLHGKDMIIKIFGVDPIKKWAICYDFLIFTLEEGNQNSDALHIVNLGDNNKVLKIRNFSMAVKVDHMVFFSNIIYVAHGMNIKVLKLSEEQAQSEDVDVAQLSQSDIHTDSPIHGFVQLKKENSLPLVMFEAPDNQLDFNLLWITETDSINGEGISYKFLQVKEKCRRLSFVADPIKQVECIINNGLVYAFALRESSSFDLYYNMIRTESCDDYKIQNLTSNIKGFLFQAEDEFYTLYHKGDKSLSATGIQDSSYQSALDPTDLSFAHYETIKTIVKFYSSVAMLQETQQVVFAHDQYLSYYCVEKDQFIGHVDMGSNILLLFDIDYPNWHEPYHCVLLENGETKYIYVWSLDENGLPSRYDKLLDNPIEDKIISVINEKTNSYPVYLLTEDSDGDKYVKAIIKHGKLVDVKLQGEIGERFNIVPFTCKKKSYVLVQMNQEIYIYEQKGSNEDDFLLSLLMNHGEQSQLEGNIHSVSTKDPEKHLILFDERNGYILKMNPFSFTQIENVFVSCLLQDDQYQGFYALKGNDNDKNDEGYFFLDVDSTVQNKNLAFIQLAVFDIKPENVIYKGFSNSRLGFFQSLYKFVISIIPNQNMNKFFNAIRSNNYTIYKQIKDMVIVLDDKDNLITYDVVTGKRKNVCKGNFSLEGFRQYNPRGYKTTLFCKDFEGEEPNLSDYFEPWQLETFVKNQMSFRMSCDDYKYRVFREVEIINEREMKIHMEYIFPVSAKNDVYLISNNKKDLLIARDSLGWTCLYKVIPAKDSVSRNKLVVLKNIPDFPLRLHHHYRYRLDFFSPDFTKFIGYNWDSKTYYLVDTFTGDKNEISLDYLSQHSEQYPKISPQMVINRFEWIDEKVFRICSEDGLEKLIDTEDNFNEISFNQIPLFNQIEGAEWYAGAEYHIFKSRRAASNPIVKSKRIYQDYKSKQFLFKDTPRSEFNQLLFQQDFEQFDHFSHSFTLLNWNIAESCQNDDLKLKDVSDGLIEGSLYAIFPGGNTFLHYISEKPDEIETLLNKCHPELKSIKYHIPIILNGLNETVLSKAVEKKAFKTANNLLKHLSLYPADHHSRAISNIYPELIRLNLPDFDTYMESRFQQSYEVAQIQKLALREEFEEIQVSTPWLRYNDHFYDSVTDYSQPERKVKVEILDISCVYHYNEPIEDKFFDALASTDQFSYFELKSIQKLIDFNFPIVQKYLIRKLFIPYFFFLGLYVFFVFFLYEHRFDKTYEAYYWTVLGSIVLFGSYFMLNEVRQMRNDGLEYFKSVWNYIDTLPVFGIYVMLAFALIEEFGFSEGEFNRPVQRGFISIVTLLMWMKFLYFFRLFDSTSYLIRIIVEVVISMRYFLLVLLMTIIGFGNAFYVISNGNVEDPLVDNFFITSYLDSIVFSYRMILGDFNTTEFGALVTPLCIVLFLIFTVFNMIVMLNLLIAIISDAYAAVAEMSEQATYQERASMIAENNYLIPDSVKESYAKQGQFLLVITDLEKEEKPKGDDAIIQKIEELKADVTKQIDELKSENRVSIGGIDKSVEQLQIFLLSTMPKDEIYTKLTSYPVEKMTLFQVRNLHEEGEYEEWYCQGQNFIGCYSNDCDEDGCINNDETTVYRCDQCGYDICEDCYPNYDEPHIHPLEAILLKDLKIQNPAYESGFGCDARTFEGCKNKGKRYHDKFSILYHNVENQFDLCTDCAKVYKIENHTDASP